MTARVFALAMIVGLMLSEWRLSRRHEAWLDAAGATAPPEPQYPLMAAAYPLAFLAMGAEAVWRGAPVGGAFASGALLFVAAKALKFWAIGTLGERWTFKVRVLRGWPLVSGGPYKYVAHPNYVAVAGELAATALMMGAFVTGPLMTGAFCMLMWRRVRFEERALSDGAR
jgi:methyltransferase